MLLLYNEFHVGEELDGTHLMASIEVHLMIIYECTCSYALITERPT